MDRGKCREHPLVNECSITSISSSTDYFRHNQKAVLKKYFPVELKFNTVSVGAQHTECVSLLFLLFLGGRCFVARMRPQQNPASF